MKKIGMSAGLAVLMLSTAGCFASKTPTPVAAECPVTYELGSAPETLGSSGSFKESAAEALAAGTTTSLSAIAADAGWQGAWDRMVIVKSGMPADYVARIAQTPDTCWNGIPGLDDHWDGAGYGYYVFLDDARPVQSVQWQSAEAYFGYNGDPVLGAEIPLESASSDGNLLLPQS